MSNNNEELDTLIRDITKVGFAPKSETRRRIEEMLSQAEHRGKREGLEEARNIIKVEFNKKDLRDINRISVIDRAIKNLK